MPHSTYGKVILHAMFRLASIQNRPNYQRKKVINVIKRFNSRFDKLMEEMRNGYY